MEKMTLVLDRRDTTVNLDGKSLQIRPSNEPMQRIPLGMLGQVIVYGSPQVSCDVWRALSESGVSALLLPSRGGGASAWLGSGISTSIMIRIKQYQAWNDPVLRVGVVSWLLKLKISGVRELLNLLIHNDSIDIFSGLIQGPKMIAKVLKAGKKAGGVLEKSIQQLDTQKNIDSLRGIEGASGRSGGTLLIFFRPRFLKSEFAVQNMFQIFNEITRQPMGAPFRCPPIFSIIK